MPADTRADHWRRRSGHADTHARAPTHTPNTPVWWVASPLHRPRPLSRHGVFSARICPVCLSVHLVRECILAYNIWDVYL